MNAYRKEFLREVGGSVTHDMTTADMMQTIIVAAFCTTFYPQDAIEKSRPVVKLLLEEKHKRDREFKEKNEQEI